LLQVLDEGILTDSTGRKINFKNTIIIMTSNIGADKIIGNKRLGFGAKEEYLEEEKIILKEQKMEFRAEFINRIDNIIVFRKLETKDLIKIIDILIEKVSKRLENKKIKIKLSEDVKKYIVEKEIDINYGARQLERKIKEIVEDTIANQIIEGKLKEENTIEFFVKDNTINWNIN